MPDAGKRFYADAETVIRAVETGRPFNIIHLQGAYKFDIFPAGEDRFAHSELARRRYMNSTLNGVDRVELPVTTAEDTVLAKLVWFRKGGEVSDRQWHDILGIIQVQREHLDAAYLERWAADLDVSDLLKRALSGCIRHRRCIIAGDCEGPCDRSNRNGKAAA